MGITPLIMGGIGLAGSLFGGGGDSPQNVQLPPMWNMPNMTQAAQGAFQGIQNLPGQETGGLYAPLAQQTGLNLYNNPYAGQLQQGANVAGGMGQQAGLNQFGAGSLLGAGGATLMGAAPWMLAQGMDPQQELYKRTAGQLTDATLANLSNAGIGTTPYGQSVLGNTLGNFNIDWQNQQLQRALMGAQGAAGLTGAGGTAFGQMSALQGQAPSTYLQGAGLPYQTYAGIGSGQLGGLGQAQGVIGGGQQLSQLPIQDYLSYIGAGNQAAGVANQQAQLALQQQQQAFNQQQIQGKQLGQSAGLLSSGLFGGGVPGMGYGNFGGMGWGGGGGGLLGSMGGGFGNLGSMMML